MQPYVKRCKYCNGENLQDTEKCTHCGRFFVVPTKPAKRSAANLEAADWIKNPVVISAVVLFISLFLEWLSVGFAGANAFVLAKGFGAIARASAKFGGGFTLSLARAFILLIPAGCAVTLFMVITGRSYRLSGILTGALPLAIFLVLQMEVMGQLTSFIGGGFILAILAGAVMIYFARRKDFT